MEDQSSSETHDLLLALAGRVDDDLLAWARELVAVGEDGHAVELLSASLIADRAVLPTAVRRALVDAARAGRIDLDPAAALPPAAPEDGTEHRFEAGDPGDAVAGALLALPSRQLRNCRVLLARRLTPAGSAPGPLPHPVVLLEVRDRERPTDVLAYQLGVALQRAGTRASVEVLTSDAIPSAYHAEALRCGRLVRSEGDGEKGGETSGGRRAGRGAGRDDGGYVSGYDPGYDAPAPRPGAATGGRRHALEPAQANPSLFEEPGSVEAPGSFAESAFAEPRSEEPGSDDRGPAPFSDAGSQSGSSGALRGGSLFDEATSGRPQPDRSSPGGARPDDARPARSADEPIALPRRTAPLSAVRSVFDEAPAEEAPADPRGPTGPPERREPGPRAVEPRNGDPRSGDPRSGDTAPPLPSRRGPREDLPQRPAPRPTPSTRPSVTPISRVSGTNPVPIRRNGSAPTAQPFAPAGGADERPGDAGRGGPQDAEPTPATRPDFDPLNDPLDGQHGRPLFRPAGREDGGRPAGVPDGAPEDSWSGDWLSGAWAMPGGGPDGAAEDRDGGPGRPDDAPGRGEGGPAEPVPGEDQEARHRQGRGPAGDGDGSNGRGGGNGSGSGGGGGGAEPPTVVNVEPVSVPIPLPPARRRAIPMPSGRSEPDPPPPEPAPPAAEQSDLGLRPESLARLSDSDRQLLARLQAELLDGGKPRVSRTAGIGGTTSTSDTGGHRAGGNAGANPATGSRADGGPPDGGGGRRRSSPPDLVG